MPNPTPAVPLQVRGWENAVNSGTLCLLSDFILSTNLSALKVSLAFPRSSLSQVSLHFCFGVREADPCFMCLLTWAERWVVQVRVEAEEAGTPAGWWGWLEGSMRDSSGTHTQLPKGPTASKRSKRSHCWPGHSSRLWTEVDCLPGTLVLAWSWQLLSAVSHQL